MTFSFCGVIHVSMSIATQPTRDSICNAESVLLSDVLNALDRARSSVLHLQTVTGLSADSSGRLQRDRWEITQGKILSLNLLEDEIRKLPSYLTGEKPDLLSLLEFERARFRRQAVNSASSHEQGSDDDDSRHEVAWFRAHCISEFLADFLRDFIPFPGHAEEQPGPREESPGPIGVIPCDGPGGESLPCDEASSTAQKSREWVETLGNGELSDVFESARVELASRGAVIHFSLTGI